MPITGLDVTYGAALAPAGFHRVTRLDGHSADLNAHSGGVGQAYLWYHEGQSRGAPIVEVDVLHDNDPVPEGWEKVARDMSKGSSRSSYICFRRTSGAKDEPLPLAEVKIAYGDEQPEGFLRLEKPLCKGEKPLFFCYKRATEATSDAPPWSAAALQVGDLVDLKDMFGKWVVAQVVGATETSVTCRPEGSRWDESFSKESSRLAALGTRTGGAEAGARTVPQGQQWSVTVDELAGFISRMKTILETEGLLSSKEEVDQFCKVDVPAFIETALSSSVEHNVMLQLLCAIKTAMSLLVRVIAELGTAPMPASIQRAISMMLLYDPTDSGGGSTCCYMFKRYAQPDQIIDNFIGRYHDYLDIPQSARPGTHLSNAYIALVNMWGEDKGYHAVAWRVRTAPLVELPMYLTLMHKLLITENRAVKATLAPIVNRLAARTAERFNRVTNEELSAVSRPPHQDVMDRIERDLYRLLFMLYNAGSRTAAEKDRGQQGLERFWFLSGRRLLTSPFLPFRIKGLSNLNEVGEHLARRSSGSSSWATRPPQDWMTFDQFVEWLVDEQILELVLGDPVQLKRYKLEDTHYELVRRTEGLMESILQRQMLSNSHIEALWNASLNQAPDTQVRCVYKFINAFATKLTPEQLSLLSRHARELPQPYEDFHLELIIGLTAAAQLYERSRWSPERDDGFALLWNVALGEGPESKRHVMEAATEAVVALVKRVDKVPVYARECLEAIRQRRPAHHALSLLRKLIDSYQRYYSSREDDTERGQLIMRLDREEGGVLGVLVEELGRYRDQARAAAKEKGLLGNDEALNVALGSSRLPHKDEIELRLDMIKYLTNHSELRVELQEHLEPLIEMLVTKPLCPAETEAFLGWLSSLIPEERTSYQYQSLLPSFTKDTAVQLFLGLFATSEAAGKHGLKLAELGPLGYDCLAKFFRCVNEWEGRLRLETPSRGAAGPTLTVRRFRGLQGLEAIREVTLKATNVVVSQKAMSLLIELYVRLQPQAGMKRVVIWEELVRWCMHRIGHELSEGGNEESSLVVARSTALLRYFLQELAKPQPFYRPPAGSEPDLTVHVDVYYVDDNGTKSHPPRNLVYTFEPGVVTVGQLRARIAEDAEAEGTHVRLVTHQRFGVGPGELRSDDMDGHVLGEESYWASRLEALVLPEPAEDTAHHNLDTAPAEALEDDDGDNTAPLKLLTKTPEYFERLFVLLEQRSPEVVQDAWTVIKMVPSHAETSDKLRSLQSMHEQGMAVDWPSVLYGHTPMRLLYVLQIIHETVIFSAEAASATQLERERACQWLLAFVKAGGLAYLIKVLTAWRVEGQCESLLIKASLSELIRVCSRFIAPKAAEVAMANGQAGEGDDDMEVDEATPDGDVDQPPTSFVAVRRASAKVFADVDRPALAAKLIHVLSEVAKTVREPLAKSESTDDSSDDDHWTARGAMAMQPAGASAMNRGPVAMLSPHGRQSSGMGTRDLMRRPSWSHAHEWTRDLFLEPTIRHDKLDEPEVSGEVSVVRSSFSLLLSIGTPEGLLSDVFLKSPHAKEVIRYGLLRSGDESLRKAVARGLHRLCAEERRRRADGDGGSDVVRGLIMMTVELLDDVAEAEGGCEEFFALLTRLISAPDALEKPVEPLALARMLARQIKQRRVVEASEDDQDRALRGLLSALRALLAFMPDADPATHEIKRAVGSRGKEGLLDELFHNCLFSMPTTDSAVRIADGLGPPKCKHPESRELGLGLVLELSRHCPENLMEVLDAVEAHHCIGMSSDERERRKVRAARNKRKNSAGSQMMGAVNIVGARRRSSPTTAMMTTQQSMPYTSSKSRTGYVGLKNLGCICYMNSVMQQFYMIRGFREGVLGFDDQEEDKDESLMYQLQSLFAHLQESHKGYYNPKAFCHALKNWEGESTDPFIQQDAQEFLALFFQRVEGLIQGSRCETVLKDYFGGTLSNELIADDGKKYSERPEAFSSITVSVRNMRTLNQALEDFIAGETVDYTWESKGEDGEMRKDLLQTEKRLSFKVLPQHLIIHLKRFDFDYETMQQIKINDRLEFPMELDMRPYTLEGRSDTHVRPHEGNGMRVDDRPPEYYKYHLAGVVVHMGTAHSGHYYSYIRERTGKRRWIEFNDTFVAEFNVADLEVECFGGQETTSYGRGLGGGSWVRERIRNAFMLIYDRYDVELESTGRRDSYRPTVPEPIMEEIVRENVEFWRKTNILTDRYFQFMANLLQPAGPEGESPPELYVREIQLATRFALGTLVEAKQGDMVCQWVERLTGHYRQCPAAARWLLETLSREQETLRDLLLEVEDAQARLGTAQLLKAAMDVVQQQGGQELLLSLVDALMGILSHRSQTAAAAAVGATDACLELLTKVLEENDEARAMVLLTKAEDSQSTLAELLRLAVATEDCRGKDGDGEVVVAAAVVGGAQSQGPLVGPGSSLAKVLLESCVIPGADAESPLLKQPRHVLSTEEKALVCSREFLVALAGQVLNLPARKALRGLFEHLLWENAAMSTGMIEAISVGLDKEDGSSLKPFFRALMLVLDIPDGLREQRVETAMPRVLDMMRRQSIYIKATEVSVIMLLRLARQNELVQRWFAEEVEQLQQVQQGRSVGFWSRGPSPEPPLLCRQEVKWLRLWLQQRMAAGGTLERGQYVTKARRDAHSSSPISSYPAGASWGMSAKSAPQLLANAQDALQRLAKGEPMPSLTSPPYDSDTEPESIVGKRIKVRWTHNEYYLGVIQSYDPDTSRHHVSYDDGDQREYNLAEKTWDFVEDPEV